MSFHAPPQPCATSPETVSKEFTLWFRSGCGCIPPCSSQNERCTGLKCPISAKQNERGRALFSAAEPSTLFPNSVLMKVAQHLSGYNSIQAPWFLRVAVTRNASSTPSLFRLIYFPAYCMAGIKIESNMPRLSDRRTG